MNPTRRKQDNGTILRTIVDLTFLALALVLIIILVSDRYDTTYQKTTALEIQNLRKDVLDASMKNFTYLESKINRVAESSDTYQSSTNGRISVLETRIEMLEDRRARGNSRIVNTNTAISNGSPLKTTEE